MVTAGANAAKWRGTGGTCNGFVPIHDSCANAAEEVVIIRFIIGQQSSRQAKRSVIGFVNGGIEVIVAVDLEQRTKVFFVRQGFDVGDINNTGRDEAKGKVRLLKLQQ